MRKTAIPLLLLMLPALLLVTLAPGALAAPGDWQPGPDALLDNTYAGLVDLPTSGSTVPSDQSLAISGWVVDQAAEGWAGIDAVHVYDGLAEAGGTFLGQATIAENRSDVAETLDNPFWANSGFALTLSPGTLAAGAHALTIYAHTPAKGWWSTQVSVSVKPTNFNVGNHHIYTYAVSALTGKEAVAVTGFTIGP